MIQGHGGNIYEMAREHGCDLLQIVDMSSNVNPLGPPPGLKTFLQENLDRINVLPEVDAGDVKRAFSRKHDIDPARVAAGNGSTQIIYSLPQALKTRQALVLGPTYADYADACARYGISCRILPAEEGSSFVHSMPAVSKAIRKDGADTVFVCNPNNPTGILVPKTEIYQLCAEHPQVQFVIDEAYLPFAGEDGKASMIHASELTNVVVLNSMSKIFRIPGLRIGFAVGAPQIIEKLADWSLPWSVNSLSQAVVTWLMDRPRDTDQFVKETVSFLDAEKKFLTAQLNGSPVLRLLPSVTSFMLGRLSNEHTAEDVCCYLGRYRILIRNCANFEGLSRQYIRISLKGRTENSRLVKYLNDLNLK